MNSIKSFIRESLANVYDRREIDAFIRIILEEVCGMKPYQILLDKDTTLSDKQMSRICTILNRLHEMEPIQHILGFADFCDCRLSVNRDVLIPRPETEELVDMISDQMTCPDSRILDIGTGSGCIAIALSHRLPDAEVTALDVSDRVLAVALMNNEANHTKVRFLKADILSPDDHLLNEPFDCIVSNPPYIMEKEKKDMSKNVLDYEPALALFVPDDDPLRFYRAIADFSLGRLNEGGKLYFEINPMCADDLKAMLLDRGYAKVTVICDYYDNKRFIKAQI